MNGGPSFFRSAAFVARKDIAYMLLQRETLLWTFVMPIVFFYFIGTVTGGFGGTGPSPGAPEPLVLEVRGPGGPLVDALTRHLEAEGFQVTLSRSGRADSSADEGAPRLRVPSPPQGYATLADAVRAGQQVGLRLQDAGEGPEAAFNQFRVRRATLTTLADLAVLQEEGTAPTPGAFAALDSAPRPLRVHVTSAGRRRSIPTGFAQSVPGTLVMFTMLVLLTSGAMMLVIERRRGLLRRLASAPIAPGAVVLGKWAGKLVLGIVQIAFGVAAGTLLFRMDWGSALPMLAAVLLGWAAFNASLGILLGNLARSEAQMLGSGVLATMVLAALGGAWWPIEITPDWMQTLAHFIPTGWAMDAVHRLVSFGYGPASALPHLLGLLVATALVGWAGVRTFRYQ